MKGIYFILLAFIGFKSVLFSQNYSTEILIADQNVKTIQTTINSYQKIEKYNDANNYRYVFLKNKKIEKIEVCTTENKIKKKVEWFYQNGILIYSETNWIGTSHNELIKQEKIYTNKNEVLAWLDKENKNVDTTASDYKIVCANIITYGRNLILQNQD